MLGSTWQGSNADGAWESVGKKKEAQKLSKADKKKAKEAIPEARKLAANHVQGTLFAEGETDSVFAALDAWERKKEAREAAPQKKNDSDDDAPAWQVNGGHTVMPKKPKQPKVKKPKVSVKAAASGVDASVVATNLAEIENAYPDLPDVQLMRASDYFLSVFKACDLPFNKTLQDGPLSKAVDVPLCWLDDDIVEDSSTWFSAKPRDRNLQKVVMYLLDACLEGIGESQAKGKGHAPVIQPPKAKIGLLMVLAMIARTTPDAVLSNSKTLATAKYSNAARMPYLMWLYGQATKMSPAAGVALWVRNMLPIVTGTTKASATSRDLVLQFIEGIVSEANLPTLVKVAGKGGVGGVSLVPPTVLDTILRAAHGVGAEGVAEKDRARLAALYAPLRRMALAGGGKLGNVAQGLMPLAFATADAGAGKDALLAACYKNAIWCLESDLYCYVQWEQLHKKHPGGSAALLGMLAGASPAPPLPKEALAGMCKGIMKAGGGGGKAGTGAGELALASCKRIVGHAERKSAKGKLVGAVCRLAKWGLLALVVALLAGYTTLAQVESYTAEVVSVVVPPSTAKAFVGRGFKLLSLVLEAVRVMVRPLYYGVRNNMVPMFQHMYHDCEPTVQAWWAEYSPPVVAWWEGVKPSIYHAFDVATTNIRPGLNILFRDVQKKFWPWMYDQWDLIQFSAANIKYHSMQLAGQISEAVQAAVPSAASQAAAV